MNLFKKKVAEREGRKLSRQSICNICSRVCNRNVSNDCTVSNVPSDGSVVIVNSVGSSY